MAVYHRATNLVADAGAAQVRSPVGEHRHPQSSLAISTANAMASVAVHSAVRLALALGFLLI